MKHMKKAICFIMIILIAIGSCGCVKENNVNTVLLDHVEGKYNTSFTFICSQKAADNSRNDMVFLKDINDCVFSVYRQPSDGKIFDTYIESLIDKKLYEDIKSSDVIKNNTFGVVAIMNPEYDFEKNLQNVLDGVH